MALEVRVHQWLVVLMILAAGCGPDGGGMTPQESGSVAAASASSSSGSGSSSGATSSSGSGFTCTGDFPNGCWTCKSAYETASSCGPGSGSGSSSSSGGWSSSSGSSGSGSSSSSSGATSSSSSGGSGGFICTGDFPNGCWTCTSPNESASWCPPHDSGSSSSSSGGPSVDRTPPLTQSSVAEGTYVGAVDVAFTCSDAGSGCAGTRYTIRGLDGTETDDEYTGPVHLTETCMVKGYSTDRAGNTEVSGWLQFELLPERRAPHLRIGQGSFTMTAWGTGRVVDPAWIDLTARYYPGLNYSLAGAVTASGAPLPVFERADYFLQSGAALGLSSWIDSDTSRLFAAPGVVPPLPLRIRTAGPTADHPAAPPAAEVELRDFPMLIGVSRAKASREFRFTGPLVRGSAGPFDRLVVSGGGPEWCQRRIPRDSPMLSFARSPDRWHDVVKLRPDAQLAACLSTSTSVLLQFEWDAPAARWFEAAPFSRSGGLASPPYWTVTLTLYP